MMEFNPDEIIALAKAYALARNNCGIAPPRRVLFVSPEGDDFTRGRLVEVEADALVEMFKLRFVTDDNDYLVQNPDIETMTPRYWGKTVTGWAVYPEKFAFRG